MHFLRTLGNTVFNLSNLDLLKCCSKYGLWIDKDKSVTDVQKDKCSECSKHLDIFYSNSTLLCDIQEHDQWICLSEYDLRYELYTTCLVRHMKQNVFCLT